METSVEAENENWAVELTRDDGEKAHPARDGFDSIEAAEYFAQCLWAGPSGREVAEARVRRLPHGEWLEVRPASVCGGVRG